MTSNSLMENRRHKHHILGIISKTRKEGRKTNMRMPKEGKLPVPFFLIRVILTLLIIILILLSAALFLHSWK